MRIWSIHPKYLDSKGLVALWRETLLAKHVLEGKTKGYTNHPQLDRFKASGNPLDAINYYLSVVLVEAREKNYNFDTGKIDKFKKCEIEVTSGQVAYETQHLLNKLKVRDPERYLKFTYLSTLDIHPLFVTVEGDIEKCEKIE